jgi:hypothetical protein
MLETGDLPERICPDAETGEFSWITDFEEEI